MLYSLLPSVFFFLNEASFLESWRCFFLCKVRRDGWSARMLGVGHCTGEGWHLHLQPLSWAGSSIDFNLLVLTRLSTEERPRHRHNPFKSPRHVGDASRFDEHDALFREGHFKAGAPSGIRERFHGERSSVSAGQAAQPRWIVRAWRAGEVGWPRLSGGRGEVWTRWGCLNIDRGYGHKIFTLDAAGRGRLTGRGLGLRRPHWPYYTLTFSLEAQCFTSWQA